MELTISFEDISNILRRKHKFIATKRLVSIFRRRRGKTISNHNKLNEYSKNVIWDNSYLKRLLM